MLLDVGALESGFEIAADVAIIGAGAAGITIARELAGSPLSVVVCESGGLEPDPATQALYRGTSVGLPYHDLAETRVRCFGGSTNHWMGELGRLDRLDFETRAWVPWSGWPITFEELAPYCSRALALCGGVEAAFVPPAASDIAAPAFDPAVFRVAVRQGRGRGPVRFGAEYRAELVAATNVRVLLGATVTELVATADATHVEALEVHSLAGRRGRVRARACVLACGGLENPRLLLASNRVVPDGLGNARGLVGRFFMDHVIHRPALLFAARRTVGALRRGPTGGAAVVRLPDVVPAPALQRRLGILDFGAELHDARAAPEPATMRDLMALFAGLEDAETAADLRLLHVEVMQEQAPDPSSRVYLGEERDALGMRRLVLDLRLGELDDRTARVAVEMLVREIGRLGLGRVWMQPWADGGMSGATYRWRGAHHHLGTTRMAAAATGGVVDRDARVFGIDNLWIAGSSLFPSGGYTNPTVTLVALALRLVDRLKVTLA